MKLNLFIASLFLAISSATAFCQDMPLSQVIADDGKWELVSEGYQFTDAACADADGNFYFADVGKGGAVYKINLEGKVTRFIEPAPKISGMKFGPDHRLYVAVQAPEKSISAFDQNGKMTLLATNVQPNDLVVSATGDVYFTETGKHQVSRIDKSGHLTSVDQGIKAPNGITLSPDQGTLAVSDYAGSNVWAFKVEADGTLSGKEPYMTLRLPVGKLESGGDGMTMDADGRYYVCSLMGVQIFDPIGRICGVLTKPDTKFAANLGFAGPGMSYMYLTSSDKVFRRKMRTRGVVFYQSPLGK